MQSARNDESRKEASEKKGALIGVFFVVCAVYVVALYAFQPPEYSGATPESHASTKSNIIETESKSLPTSHAALVFEYTDALSFLYAQSGDLASLSLTKTTQGNSRNARAKALFAGSASGKSSLTASAPDKPTGQSRSSASTSGKPSNQASSSSSASKKTISQQSAKKSGKQPDSRSNDQFSKQSNNQGGNQSSNQSSKQSRNKSSLSTTTPAIDLSAKMTGKTLKAIPTNQTLTVFTVSDEQSPPSLAKSKKREIKRAITELKNAGYDCGFVFLDLTSGRGIARNAGESFYMASAFKAALISFALQDENADLADYERSNVEAAILYSDNDAYDSFAAAYVGQGYKDWLDSYEIEFDGYAPYYATTSAKSMARIWADLFQFLKINTDEAKWFADLLSRTNRSFIRSALENTGVTVRNQAGWIAEDGLCATTDCAYIDENGHPYLMVILTDQPDSDASNQRAHQIVKALFDARKALLPQ